MQRGADPVIVVLARQLERAALGVQSVWALEAAKARIRATVRRGALPIRRCARGRWARKVCIDTFGACSTALFGVLVVAVVWHIPLTPVIALAIRAGRHGGHAVRILALGASAAAVRCRWPVAAILNLPRNAGERSLVFWSERWRQVRDDGRRKPGRGTMRRSLGCACGSWQPRGARRGRGRSSAFFRCWEKVPGAEPRGPKSAAGGAQRRWRRR